MKIDSDYATWITTLERRFRASQVKAAIHVNQEMLRFYWSLGEDMFRLQAEARWGSGFVRKLESDLKKVLPGVKGFSFTNLNYIKRFYLMFNLNSAVGCRESPLEAKSQRPLPQFRERFLVLVSIRAMR